MASYRNSMFVRIIMHRVLPYPIKSTTLVVFTLMLWTHYILFICNHLIVLISHHITVLVTFSSSAITLSFWSCIMLQFSLHPCCVSPLCRWLFSSFPSFYIEGAFVRMCVCAYVRLCLRIYTCAYVYECVFARMSWRVCAYVFTRVRTYIWVCVCAYELARMCVRVCIGAI